MSAIPKTNDLRRIGPYLYEYKGILLKRKPIKYYNNELYWVAEMKVHFIRKSLGGLVRELKQLGIRTPAEKAKIKPLTEKELNEMLDGLPEGCKERILSAIVKDNEKK